MLEGSLHLTLGSTYAVAGLCIMVVFNGLQYGIYNKWTSTLVEQSNVTKSATLDGHLQYLNMTHMQRRMHTFGIKAINNNNSH